MTLSKGIASVLVAAALGGLAPAAWAGLTAEWPVQIDMQARRAHGGLGSARNSADAVQQIQCNIVAEAGVPDVYVACYATDQKGLFVYCGTSDPKFITVAASLSAEDLVVFEWDKSLSCSRLEVVKTSWLPPKAP